VSDYPCPKCGYDGPHTAVDEGDVWVVECGSCYAEFEVPKEPA
jgi:hypothetical protein